MMIGALVLSTTSLEQRAGIALVFAAPLHTSHQLGLPHFVSRGLKLEVATGTDK